MAPGQSSCFAVNTPFETCVAVSSGAKRVEGAAAAATVGGVQISALRTQGKGAVHLRLGVVDVGVNAADRTVSMSTPGASTPEHTPERSAPTAKPSRVLPETGSANLAVPGLMLLSVGASGLTVAVLRRRRT
jgi:LPXTG-motif cell wall-anchored protein